jgi:DNA-binding CsgD family transcriptional regulator
MIPETPNDDPSRVVDEVSRANQRRGDLAGMTLARCERDTLVAFVNGGSEREAAALRGVSIWTVENQLRTVREKLGARNTTHAVALAFSELGPRYRVSPRRRLMAPLMPVHAIPASVGRLSVGQPDPGRAS